MTSMKEILQKGGTPVLTQYNMQIGDALWECLYKNITEREESYSIDGVYTQGEENFAILKDENGKFYRLNFEIITGEDSTSYSLAEELVADEAYEAPETPMFAAEDVAAYEAGIEEEDEDSEEEDNDDKTEDEEDLFEEEKDVDKALKELQDNFTKLSKSYEDLKTELETFKTENESLKKFKAKVEKTQKEEMIESFYMLSDEDKKDVIDNIDTYSLEDIESKLSVICVRNKVSFEKENEENPQGPTSYNLDSFDQDDDIPAWVKAVKETEQSIK